MGGLFDLTLIEATLRMSVPVLLAALGGLFTARTNLFNVALEGMMLAGAFAAAAGTFYSGSVWAGVATAIGAGMLIALIFAIFTIRFKSDPIIAGIALNLVVTGLTIVLMTRIFNLRGFFQLDRKYLLPSLNIPMLERIPLFGQLLNGQNPIYYATFLMVPLIHCIIYHTAAGLRMRAVGEFPLAASAAGVAGWKYQFYAVLTSGMLSGLAGAWLVLSSLGMFTENMSAGRGFIALAAIIFGDAEPLRVAAASLIFGMAEALGIRLQGLGIPPQVVLMLPYLVTVASLTVISRRTATNR
jgi:ABC-type uncharacterized transport system permease subunit